MESTNFEQPFLKIIFIGDNSTKAFYLLSLQILKTLKSTRKKQLINTDFILSDWSLMDLSLDEILMRWFLKKFASKSFMGLLLYVSIQQKNHIYLKI